MRLLAHNLRGVDVSGNSARSLSHTGLCRHSQDAALERCSADDKLRRESFLRKVKRSVKSQAAAVCNEQSEVEAVFGRRVGAIGLLHKSPEEESAVSAVCKFIAHTQRRGAKSPRCRWTTKWPSAISRCIRLTSLAEFLDRLVSYYDGRRVIFLSMEPRRDGPGRPFSQFYSQTPTHIWIYDLQTGALDEICTKNRLAPFETPSLLVHDDRDPRASGPKHGRADV